MREMLVSVIVPAYNAERFITRALDSVLRNRTVPEILVVDDGSSDNTAKTARSWLTKRRTPGRVLRLDCNMGPAFARNRGVENASGEWVAFLDADDVWLKGKLDIQVNRAESEPAIHMWCGALSGWSRLSGRRGRDTGWQELFLEDFVTSNPVATSTVMIRKEVLKASGGFDETLCGPEDFDLWIRVAKRHRIGLINMPLAMRGERRDALSGNDETFLPEILRVLDKAFAAGGAFAPHPEWRTAALSNQYWNASWMAFLQGSRARALSLLLRAWLLHLRSSLRPQREWIRLATRYLLGRPERRRS